MEKAPSDQQKLDFYYNKFVEKVTKNSLSIYPLVAIPRSSSTILSNCLMRSDSFDNYFHEPFTPLSKVHLTPELLAEKKDLSYKNLYNSVTKSSQNSRMLIKVMAAWVGYNNNEYIRFYSTIQTPPLFIIRDPILTTASRMRKVIETFELRYKETIITTLISLLGEKYNKRQFSLNYQQNLLNDYARSEGFSDWRTLVTYITNNNDFKTVEPFLLNIDIYNNNTFSGIHAVEQQVGHLTSLGRDLRIVDSTVLRSDPQKILHQICNFWDIKYDHSMLSWGSNETFIDLGQQKKEYQKIWYKKAKESNCWYPPESKIPDINKFPMHIKKYIKNKDFPAYERLMKNRDLLA